jgi:oxygen-independent coproporphyrinogen-3 oxidase
LKEFSLYIHIPFCVKKCAYCDFTSYDNCSNTIEAYVEALLKEIETTAEQLNHKVIYSIFIGGGTPSLLSPEHIYKIFSCIKGHFEILPEAEITIECNPGTLTEEKMACYKGVGINRISLGLQSTHDHHLKNLGRIHNYKTFLKNYHALRAEGFNNINVDLMFALPNQTLREWEETIQDIIKLKPEHISKYSLSIEKGTPFYTKYKSISNIIEEELERKMYYNAQAMLIEAGYKHYEISNYSLEGYECQHNIVYWTLKPYIGMGLSAASFYHHARFENTTDLHEYINREESYDTKIIERKKSSQKALMEEYMFLGLRLLKGINKQAFEQQFQQSFDDIYKEICGELKGNGLINETQESLALTQKGIDISNYVLSQFLLD